MAGRKEKERGKGSGKSRSNHRDYGNPPRLDPKIEETKQERNQEHKDKIIKETSKRKSSKTDKDITVRDHNKKIADKLKEYQDTSDDEEGHEEKRKRKKAITQAAWKRIRKKNREPRVNSFYG